MSSVQSEIICPECKYEHCLEDYSFPNDEVLILCERCGYTYNRSRKYDIEKSKRIHAEITAALSQKEYKQAFEITHQRLRIHSKERGEYTDEQFTDEEYKNHAEEFLKRIEEANYKLYWLFDQDKHPCWTEEEIKPLGAMRRRYKGTYTGCGSYTDRDGFLKEIEENKDHIEEALITCKNEKGEWITHDCLTNTDTPFKGSRE